MWIRKTIIYGEKENQYLKISLFIWILDNRKTNFCKAECLH